MDIIEKLHEIEKAKVIYDIHYCLAGIGFVFWDKSKVDIMSPDEWRTGLTCDRYYPSFEDAVNAEYEKLFENITSPLVFKTTHA